MKSPRVTVSRDLGARLACICIGILVAFCNVNSRVLLGDKSLWRDVGYDQGGGLAAFRFFQSESWGYPLLVVRSLGENGTGIIFTDSNALLAIVAKTFSFLPVESERWWGLWILLLFAGQSVSICHFLQSLGVRRIEILISGALIGVLTPFFLFRLQHPALAAHFLIILAMSYLARISLHEETRCNVTRLATITLASFLVHPYIFAMCMIVLFAALWVALSSRQITLRGATRPVLVLFLAVLMIFWQADGLGRKTAPSNAGPIYSTSLFSPISPQKSSVVPDGNFVEPLTSWEGFAWIGLGNLFLAAGALAMVVKAIRSRSLKSAVQGKWGLLGCATFAFWFALGPELHLIDTITIPYPFTLSRLAVSLLVVLSLSATIIRLAPSDHRTRGRFFLIAFVASAAIIIFGERIYMKAFDYFRANGRFVWMLSYLIITAGFLMISRQKPRVLGASVCVVVALLQIVDTGRLRDWPNELVIEDSLGRNEGIDSLRDFLRPLESISIWPPQSCLTSAQAAESFRDVVIAASIEQTPVRSNYAARPIVESCALDAMDQSEPRIAIVQGVDDLSPEQWSCYPVWTLHACDRVR